MCKIYMTYIFKKGNIQIFSKDHHIDSNVVLPLALTNNIFETITLIICKGALINQVIR